MSQRRDQREIRKYFELSENENIMHSLVYIIIDAETPCFKGSSNCHQFLFLRQVLNLRERHIGGSPWADIFLLQDHST